MRGRKPSARNTSGERIVESSLKRHDSGGEYGDQFRAVAGASVHWALTLGIVPASARVSMHPVHAFNMYGDEVHVELVSSGVTVTDSDELALYLKAFDRMREAALYGDAAKELLVKALSFWTEPSRG
ncbi:Scr1 family TA system antitoxin-like transcriptional regulator [Streptomyces jumonjinensis]|uniref:Scr1 family TA system antitoxin-like transcriptional regulator n=1 Tax=Streptomyces jumonjinensis TaxID=1945 RepID=UPI003799EC6B